MNRNGLIGLIVVLLVGTATWAQNGKRIQITKFEISNSVITKDVLDRNGMPCAVIRFFSDDMNYVIEPNLGKLKTDTLIGEIRIWVPKDTRLITVRHEGVYPLVNYKIPMRIESKHVYAATIDMIEGSRRAGKEAISSRSHPFYIGAGYSVTPMMGPTVALGLSLGHHNIEAGATYGLKATDDLYLYGTEGTLKAGYHYTPIKIQLRYGYEVNIIKKAVSITPQVGGSYHLYMGQNAENLINDGSYKNAQSISALGALRLTWSPTKHLKLHVTPEYLVSIKNDNVCNTLCWYDDDINKWNEGMSLNAGLMFYF